jgi:hypothetical protein
MAAALPTDYANVGTQPRHLPEAVSARVGLLHSQDVANLQV